MTERGSAENVKAVAKSVGQARKAQADQIAAAAANAMLKHTRSVGGAERLGKQLHLLTHNALSLALYGSEEEAVRVMDPNTVFALLLDRPATTCIENGKLTLWVEADRRRQVAPVEVINKLELRCRGCVVTIRVRHAEGTKAC